MHTHIDFSSASFPRDRCWQGPLAARRTSMVVISNSDGSTFEGQLKDGKPHGMGECGVVWRDTHTHTHTHTHAHTIVI